MTSIWKKLSIVILCVAAGVLVTSAVTHAYAVPMIPYMLLFGHIYGMPDDTRTVVDCIGKEINTLRAENTRLYAYDSPDAQAKIDVNTWRINELFNELDRVWPAGANSLGIQANVTMKLDCHNDKYNFAETDDADGIVGGRNIFGETGCTSGVVVQREVLGEIETGILTNAHCGNVVGVIMNGGNVIGAKKTMGSFPMLLCDCAFVRIEDGIDHNIVWTDWGGVRISKYEDFEKDEWVEFHGRNGYSLGRVLKVIDVGISKGYLIDVKVSNGDSGGPFLGLKDRSFGGMNAAAQDGCIDIKVAFGHAWSTVQHSLDVHRP